jgi:hypothetical protein
VYLTKEHALSLLTEAATEFDEAGQALRTAIRDALRSNAPVDQIAQRAQTTVETVRAISAEPLPDLVLAPLAPPGGSQ